jgi:hypothetical protein
MLYNIHNPTAARRIIYDGSSAQRKIEIPAGEWKHNVAVEPHIAAGFGDGRNGDKSDLWLIPVDAAPNPPPPPAEVTIVLPEETPVSVVALPATPQPDYKRYQAPLIEDPIEKAIEAEAAEEKTKSKKKAKRKAHVRHA